VWFSVCWLVLLFAALSYTFFGLIVMLPDVSVMSMMRGYLEVLGAGTSIWH